MRATCLQVVILKSIASGQIIGPDKGIVADDVLAAQILTFAFDLSAVFLPFVHDLPVVGFAGFAAMAQGSLPPLKGGISVRCRPSWPGMA